MTCRMPYENLEIRPNGTMGVCCVSKFDITKDDGSSYTYGIDSVEDALSSNSLKDFRKRFDRSEKPSVCRGCWSLEDAGMESKRIIENRRYHNQVSYIRSLDIKPGNVCNLKCRICSSYASSRWIADEIKLNGKSAFPLMDWPEQVGFADLYQLVENVEYIEISGGEPFMLATQWQFIDFIIKNGYAKNISIQYHTNGTFLDRKWLDMLSEFKRCHMSLSIDGLGRRFEYQRHPAKWDKVSRHLEQFAEMQIKEDNFSATYSHSVSSINVFYLGEFCEWVNRSVIPVYFNVVHNVMPVTDLNDGSKRAVIDHLKKTLPTDTSKQINPLLPESNWLYNLMMENPGGNNEHIRKRLDSVDAIRGESYAAVFPEMYEILNYEL